MSGIKRTRTILSVTLICMLHAASALCAPTGNIGDPALWKDGVFTEAGSFSLFISAVYDSQKNFLSPQQRRTRWDDPRTGLKEDRHYEQIRSSESTINCTGGKLGAVFWEAWTLYALAGVCDTDLTFYHTDTTVSFGFEVDNGFTSKSDLYYGFGTSIILHRDTFRELIPLTLGMDIRYRRFDFEDDSLEINNTFYSATLNEIQMAVLLSADTGRLHPYVGLRISSITGKEHYINKNVESVYYPEEHIDYKDDITWSKNFGFVAGVSLHLLETFSINVESRSGDEEGLGVSVTVKF